jgi:hypothetical protein
LADQILNYKGTKLVLRPDANPPELLVDDRPAPLEVSHNRRSYFTLWIPHRTFPSLLELAKALVDMRELRSGKKTTG